MAVTAFDLDHLARRHRGDEVADRARLGRQADTAVPGAPGLEQPGVTLEGALGVGGVAVGADLGVAREITRDGVRVGRRRGGGGDEVRQAVRRHGRGFRTGSRRRFQGLCLS
ncbi:hypothetical protein [Skermanella aerolata]|uniref:hypothetical protein n=1 Tax=Skermanella aerolata TaxID=393310 RepID=UPI0011BDB16C|nr:hypothetical protein [Skermanella aerolata]